MIYVRTSSGLKQIGSVSVRTSAGLRAIGSIMVRTASGLKTVFSSALPLQVSPAEADGFAASKGSPRVPTNQLTVSGYSGSATIVWTVPTGWSVVNQGAATTGFLSPSLSPGSDVSAAGSVAVTSSGTTSSASFSLYASNQGFS